MHGSTSASDSCAVETSRSHTRSSASPHLGIARISAFHGFRHGTHSPSTRTPTKIREEAKYLRSQEIGSGNTCIVPPQSGGFGRFVVIIQLRFIMGIEIHGKVALVTGANRGIGKAIVVSLLAHGASKVYCAVRNPQSLAPLQATYGSRVIPVEVDLSIPGSIAAAAKIAADVQIVINNAGVLRSANPLAHDAIEALEYEMKVNVEGLIRMAQAFTPVLAGKPGAAFVQLNSVASLKSFPEFSTYCASKAAAYSITQALRETLRPRGIHVLSVHPGPIATDMADDAGLADIAEPVDVVSEGIVAALRSGDFHLFPDTMARQIGEAYADFARSIIEGVEPEVE